MKRRPIDGKMVGELWTAAAGPLLVAFDLDGTLAPIARDRSAARLSRSTRALLSRVARLYPTVILTGRSRADARARIKGIRLAAIVGNHGLESGARHRAARATVRRWRAQLAEMPSLDIEDKGESLSLHFRAAANPGLAKRDALRAVSRLDPRPRVIEGKALLNVIPDIGIDKGTALRALMRAHGLRSAIYVGDDLTDEDVFGLPESAGVLTVRVGRSFKSRAKHCIPRQDDINALLAELIEARRAASARGA